jgi:hypothetical protein
VCNQPYAPLPAVCGQTQIGSIAINPTTVLVTTNASVVQPIAVVIRDNSPQQRPWLGANVTVACVPAAGTSGYTVNTTGPIPATGQTGETVVNLSIVSTTPVTGTTTCTLSTSGVSAVVTISPPAADCSQSFAPLPAGCPQTQIGSIAVNPTIVRVSPNGSLVQPITVVVRDNSPQQRPWFGANVAVACVPAAGTSGYTVNTTGAIPATGQNGETVVNLSIVSSTPVTGATTCTLSTSGVNAIVTIAP